MIVSQLRILRCPKLRAAYRKLSLSIGAPYFLFFRFFLLTAQITMMMIKTMAMIV